VAYKVVQKGSESQLESPSYPICQQHRRLNVRLPIRVSSIDPEVDAETGKPFFRISEEYSSNLSGGGVFIVCADAVTPGRRVLVEIEVPNGETVQALGQVIWKRSGIMGPSASPGERPGFGVSFMAPQCQHLEGLDRYLSIALMRRPVATPSVALRR
jgi:hypothetical protein